MRWKLNDLPPELRRQVEDKLNERSVPNSSTISIDHLEHPLGIALEATQQGCVLDPRSRYKVRATQYRRRLIDPDGGSIKAVLDALVVADVIKDDSAAYIESVEIRQVKVD